MKQAKRFLSCNTYCQYFLCAALLTLSNSLFSADMETNNSNSLADQITDTQRSAEQLQSQLKSSNANTLTPASTMPGHQGKKMMPMGMMDDQKSKKNPADSMGGNMNMMDEKSGMENPADNANSMRGNMGNMGNTGNMGRMKNTGMNNADGKLPAFPGNKHLYHLGANNFFLDSTDAIGLTSSQQQQLKQISLNWQNADQQYNKKIEQSEQDLWQLTGSDVPNSQQIEQKVREIEAIKTQERIAFIRAVGEAATILTAEQRLSLIQTDVPPESMRQQ